MDVIADAIEDARENAALNKIESAVFFNGDVVEICNDDFFTLHGRAGLIIVDPPRAGLHSKLVNKLLEISSEKIVYISCNAATQARDLQLLSEKYNVDVPRGALTKSHTRITHMAGPTSGMKQEGGSAEDSK